MNEDNLEELAFLEMKELEEMLKMFLNKYFAKPYELECRVKSMAKIKQKQQLYSSRGKNYDLFDVLDIIGFRISVDTEAEHDLRKYERSL